jgi:hypothetical protein
MSGSAYLRGKSLQPSGHCHFKFFVWGLLFKGGGQTAALQNAPAPPLAGLGFGLLGGYGLIDLEEGHFQFAEEVEEEGIFLGG